MTSHPGAACPNKVSSQGAPARFTTSPLQPCNAARQASSRSKVIKSAAWSSRRTIHGFNHASVFSAPTCSSRSRASICRRTSPEAMPRTILASVCSAFSPEPASDRYCPRRRHSSASRFSSSLVSSRPLNRPCMPCQKGVARAVRFCVRSYHASG